ncbi:MAG TPA: 2-oxoacid:acceptor oxidoreductase subunit alpha, partial [Clostridia bacterium]|nr:2-oxoacid:acceptor oxidoreductase subunit alpha [Clostridia bacterium]
IKAGAKFYAGYPITPSSEIAALASESLPAAGGVYIQMEDEVGSMAALVGASITGAKSFTATSGPGFSLMQENLGLAVMTEAPCVIIDVQRVGPSTGNATKAAQSDVMQARWGTHGEHAIIALSPSTVQECYDLTIQAFNLAEKYRTPVVLLSDATVGHMREKVVLRDLPVIDRTLADCEPSEYMPFKAGGNKIPPMAKFGSDYIFHVTSSMHDEKSNYGGTPQHADKLIRRLHDKIYDNAEDIAITREFELKDAEIVLVSYGISARSSREAVNMFRKQGIKAGLLQLNTIWPFPDKKVEQAAAAAKAVIVPELNLGQLINEVKRVVNGRTGVYGVNKVETKIITPYEIVDKVKEVLQY